MIYRIRFRIGGGHVHCALFNAKQANMTFAKCGDFTVRRGEEFASLLRSFSGAEFIGDGGSGITAACNEDDSLPETATPEVNNYLRQQEILRRQK